MPKRSIGCASEGLVFAPVHLCDVQPGMHLPATRRKRVRHCKIRGEYVLVLLAQEVPVNPRNVLVGERVEDRLRAEVGTSGKAGIHALLRPHEPRLALVGQALDVLCEPEAPLRNVDAAGVVGRVPRDACMHGVVGLKQDHVLGVQRHGSIVDPPEEWPRVPAVIRRGAQLEDAALPPAQLVKAVPAVAHEENRGIREELLQLPHLVDYCCGVAEDVEEEPILGSSWWLRGRDACRCGLALTKLFLQQLSRIREGETVRAAGRTPQLGVCFKAVAHLAV
mmetsp:Transcript_61552/g.174828  ORF Transcript_61552/g.174828 Transcript_61552/m.174828 type:complete len:279 (+) Transcript_61552:371-1207(+)